MLKKLIPDWLLKRMYYRAGAIYGDALSYSYMGECVGFKRMQKRYAKWEAEYARRGYKTIPIDNFIAYGGGYAPKLEGCNIKLKEAETQKFYA